MNAALILKIIDAALSVTTLLQGMGINYSEVLEAQQAAEAEGRELSDAELQVFVDQAQDAIDQL